MNEDDTFEALKGCPFEEAAKHFNWSPRYVLSQKEPVTWTPSFIVPGTYKGWDDGLIKQHVRKYFG